MSDPIVLPNPRDAKSADIITPNPPDVPTVGARPYWFPDTRGFLAGAVVLLIFSIVMTLLWHPVPLTEQQAALLYLILGILLGCFKDVYNFSFSSTQEGADKNKTIASMGASLGSSVPVAVVPSSVTLPTELPAKPTPII